MGETTISRLVDKVNELSDSEKQLRDQLAAKDREIAELRKAVQRAEQSRDMTQSLLDEWRQAAPQRDEAIRHLGELLAVIHRDGGQYQAEHGAAKATQDALSKLSSLRCELYDLQGEYDETVALFGAWKQRAEQAEHARDEARECVKRLHQIATEHADCLQIDVDNARIARKRENYQAQLDELRAALAATPEHLR